MVRLLLHLLKIKDFEPCKSCETLKTQLDFANIEKKELLETLLILTKPEVIIKRGDVKVLNPLQQAGGTFARRRGILEDMHKRKEETLKSSPFVAKADDDDVKKDKVTHITPETITSLEQKLGLNEKENAS